jgi:hypothetical protein
MRMGSRTSNRVRPVPNYASMNTGNGEPNEHIAYQSEMNRTESNGVNASISNSMLPPGKQTEKEAKMIAKKKGMMLKVDVFNKCHDMLRMIYSNENFKGMVKVAAQAPVPGQEGTETAIAEQQGKIELRKALDAMDRIANNLTNLQFTTASDFAFSVRNTLNDLACMVPLKIPSLAAMPGKLHAFFNDMFNLEKLCGKEIYVSADQKAVQSMARGNSSISGPDIHQSKLMHQMAKKLEEQQAQMKQLRQQLVKQEKAITASRKVKSSTPTMSRQQSSK